MRDAEAGHLAVITKHGRPTILAVPFDQYLLENGVHRALALYLFKAGQLTLTQAAKLAGVNLKDFLDLLKSAGGIDAVDYPSKELEDELKTALP